MSFNTPSNDEIREILTKATQFEWPTFDHMPLNCFDLTSAVLTFPGDISQSRLDESSIYAEYKVDIDNLDTCPKKDEIFKTELWNESDIFVPWFFGRFEWACMIDASDFILRQGVFTLGVAVARFQNIEGVYDLMDLKQLKHALFLSLTPHIDSGIFQPIKEDSIFTKIINGRHWHIARSLNHVNSPVYRAVSPIDHQAAIFIPASLGNCWFLDEVIPEEVEKKHLASFWDFLGHIHLSYTREGDVAVGSTVREAPGQAEKIDDLPEW